MKPVNHDDLDDLLQRKPIVLVHKCMISSSFLKAIVQRSPSNIQTEGGKRLPMELWLKIIDLLDTRPQYVIAQPQCIKQTEHDGPVLVCTEIVEWERCGDMECDPYTYSGFLQEPAGCQEINGKMRPFNLAEGVELRIPTFMIGAREADEADEAEKKTNEAEEEIDKDARKEVKANNAKHKLPILFDQITIPDIISRAENGNCDMCGGQRPMCAGCRDGRSARESFGICIHQGNCGIIMFCPLCIGSEYAQESIMQHGMPDCGGYEDDEVMTDAEYKTWQTKILKELGYK